MNKPILVFALVGAIGAGVAIDGVIGLDRKIKEFRPKAEKFDSLCSAVKTMIDIDIREAHRENVISDFGGDSVVDGAAVLTICATRPVDLSVFRICSRTKDIDCAVAEMKKIRDAIP